MRLTGLDKKLFIVQQKLTVTELNNLKIGEEQLKQAVQNAIYQKTLELLFKTTKIKQRAAEDGIVWEYKMFMFSEQELYTLLLEVLELNESDRTELVADMKKVLGIFS